MTTFRRDLVPLAVLALFALAPVAGLASYEFTQLARIMILGIAALSLSLLVGGAGLISFGHAATIGFGAYAVAILDAQNIVDAAVVVPVAMLAAALFALLTGAVAIRSSGVHFIMMTLAFSQMAYFTASSLAAYGGDDGYTLYARNTLFGSAALQDRLVFHYACLALLVMTWLFCRVLLASRFGRVLRAARENALRVQAVGLEPYPFRLIAYVIAGAIGGLAGVLLANATEFVSPAYLSWQRSGELLFMVILGGVGRLHGAILGAIAYVLLEERLAALTEHWRLIFGPLLILAVLFFRGGLAGLVEGRGRRHG